MSITSQKDLDGLSRVGRVVALALRAMEEAVRPGVTTSELDHVASLVFRRHGAISAPQFRFGFPAAVCISVNDEAVHGIPGERTIREGDLVKLDVTAELDGYIADAAVTVAVPPVSPTMRELRACARSAFQRAMNVARAGSRINDIGRAVEKEVRRNGFSVIRELSGHGVGRDIHEEPSIPNFFDRRYSQRLPEGLVITVEPIIAAGSGRIVQGDDGWTVRTLDGSLTAHYEHTMVITRGRPMLLTVA